MRPLERLDPRRYLAAAIGWAVFSVVALASLLAAHLAAGQAERVAQADHERLLAQFATQIRYALGVNLRTRLSIVQATAAQIVASGDRGSDALRRHIEAVQAQFPEFAWLGVADVHGRVIAATGGVLQGESVAAEPWFRQAQAAPVLGEVHESVRLQQRLSHGADGRAARVLDAAAPISHGPGRLVGVIGAQLAWGWIDRLLAELSSSLASRRPLELLLADGEGRVLVGPPAWVGQTLKPGAELAENAAYAVGPHPPRNGIDDGLPWTVVVRQPAAAALAPVQHVRSVVFLTVVLAGLSAALAAVALTRMLTRRLAALALDAQAVRRGQRESITAPPGHDEVSHIGATLSELIAHLQQEKAALAALNAELDARVAERTARIERMADEARYAAVTRERLRLARDLHDTLAHSLMALLTQIRLVRKLEGRLSAEAVDAELGRAEEVAASGLAEARAAITQMRHNDVREAGLAAALGELLSRFGERTGVASELQAEGAAADLADERAETLFRIVEEALHNIERHARARSVRVCIAGVPTAGQPGAAQGRVSVTVQDDGIGFDAAAAHSGHYGIVGMREQAALIGAQFELRSAPGEGTTLRLELPA